MGQANNAPVVQSAQEAKMAIQWHKNRFVSDITVN